MYSGHGTRCINKADDKKNIKREKLELIHRVMAKEEKVRDMSLSKQNKDLFPMEKESKGKKIKSTRKLSRVVGSIVLLNIEKT